MNLFLPLKEIWFNNSWCHYINYEKIYKKKDQNLIINENWFYKDQSFLAGFSKEFCNNKLVTFLEISKLEYLFSCPKNKSHTAFTASV